MLNDSMLNFAGLIGISVGLSIICSTPSYAAEVSKKRTTTAIKHVSQPTAQKKLQATRRMLIERMKASREQLNDSLPVYEKELADKSADYEQKQKLFQENLISKRELDNSQQAVMNTRLETERIEQLIAEDDIALSLAEEVAETEMARLPRLSPGGYDETPNLIRFNGTAAWSLTLIDKIARFYRARFGHEMPVSALGQSPTHDRLGFDHRDAIDVAVSPQSAEGRGLMSYLRKANIPFLAFRRKVRSMSTGAHIHIGQPSPRLMEVKQRQSHPAAPEQNTAGG
jgi:hypothetical protein